jgi:hypothetical protein
VLKNEFVNKNVSTDLQKVVLRVCCFGGQRDRGREVHARAAASEDARSLRVERRVAGTVSTSDNVHPGHQFRSFTAIHRREQILRTI